MFFLNVIVTKRSVCAEIPQRSEYPVQKRRSFAFTSSFTLAIQFINMRPKVAEIPPVIAAPPLF